MVEPVLIPTNIPFRVCLLIRALEEELNTNITLHPTFATEIFNTALEEFKNCLEKDCKAVITINSPQNSIIGYRALERVRSIWIKTPNCIYSRESSKGRNSQRLDIDTRDKHKPPRRRVKRPEDLELLVRRRFHNYGGVSLNFGTIRALGVE